MSSEHAEIPPPPSADLFHISLTTTREHAEAVVESAVDALGELAANFANKQNIMVGRGEVDDALLANFQLAQILRAQSEAQLLHKKLTTQGETKNED